MTTRKRQVEVFTAGCAVCEPAVELVQRMACPSCDITVHNVRDDPKAAARAKAAHITRLPMVLVDGFVRATWKVTGDPGKGVLAVAPFGRLEKTHREAVEQEGVRLLAFLAPHADAHDVRFG